MRATYFLISMLWAALLLGRVPASAADLPRFDFSKLRLGGGGEMAASPMQILGSFEYRQTKHGRLAVNREKERGAAAEVYSRVAPATVLIRAVTPDGDSWGSGVIYDADGWVITNHHVIADAQSAAKGAPPSVTIYRGRIEEDFMHLIEEGLPATVYKSDKNRDLALLKIARPASDKEKLPIIEFATQPIKPNSDCVVVGHPAAGTLWTARSGEVLNQVRFPDDMIQAVVARLGARKKVDTAAGLQKSFAAAPQWKVLVTNCNVNHGDSGGPLVNASGQLIGVTVGMPTAATAAGSSSVLSYHVHLDEVKAFLAKRPEEPAVEVPDPWPAALYSKMLDADGDGTPDTLEFSASDGGAVSGLLLDLNQTTAAALKKVALANAAADHSWKFQFALTLKPAVRAFYDTLDGGQIDLILTGRESDETADGGWRREGDKWVPFKPDRQKLVDPALFKTAAEKQRFTKIMNRLTNN